MLQYGSERRWYSVSVPASNTISPGVAGTPYNMQAENDIEGGQHQRVNEISRNHVKEEKDSTLVDWDGPDDPENPQNWSTLRKWIITTNMGLTAFCATFASSIFSTATAATASKFNVSQEVMTLGTSVFVLVKMI